MGGLSDWFYSFIVILSAAAVGGCSPVSTGFLCHEVALLAMAIEETHCMFQFAWRKKRRLKKDTFYT